MLLPLNAHSQGLLEIRGQLRNYVPQSCGDGSLVQEYLKNRYISRQTRMATKGRINLPGDLGIQPEDQKTGV